MKTKLFASFAGAALAASVANPANAQMYEGITIENSTGYTITEIYLSPSRTSAWEEDVLDWDVLANGSEVEINLRRAENTCNWDLKVVYSDGDEAIWGGLNLCQDYYFELFYNAGSGDTHLVASH